MNLLGATLVLLNSLLYGAYPSVGVNAAWIAIGAYTLAKHLSHATDGGSIPKLIALRGDQAGHHTG